MKVKNLPLSAILIIASAIFLSCGDSPSSTCLDITDDPEGNITDGLRVKLSTDKDTYLSGENPELSLTVANVSDQPINITFTSSKEYDFVICRGGMNVWTWSHDLVFAFPITEVTIQPGENYAFPGFSDGIAREIWERRDNLRNTVPFGNYTVYGQFNRYDSNKKMIRLE